VARWIEIGIGLDDGPRVGVDPHVLPRVTDHPDIVSHWIEVETEGRAAERYRKCACTDLRERAGVRINDVEVIGAAQGVELAGVGSCVDPYDRLAHWQPGDREYGLDGAGRAAVEC